MSLFWADFTHFSSVDLDHPYWGWSTTYPPICSFSRSHILSYEGILFVFAFGGREVDAKRCIRGGLQYYTSFARFWSSTILGEGAHKTKDIWAFTKPVGGWGWGWGDSWAKIWNLFFENMSFQSACRIIPGPKKYFSWNSVQFYNPFCKCDLI